MGRAATAEECYQLLIDQEYRCALSGLPLSPKAVALDHIVSVSDGGSDEIANLQWVDVRVNTMKRTLSQAEFIELCKRVAEAQL